MKIKYVCHGLISLHFNFHDNRTKWTLTSNIKICRWGGGKEKEPSQGKGTGKEPIDAYNCRTGKSDYFLNPHILTLYRTNQKKFNHST